MLTLASAEKKITAELYHKESQDVQQTLLDILHRKAQYLPATLPKGLVKVYEARMSAPHLGYLDTDQVNDSWGKSTDAAYAELLKNFGFKWTAGDALGQSGLLALLDGSIPSQRVKLAKGPLDLPVKYYSQRDSETGHAWRMCFSSSCAMLLNYLKPGVLSGDNGDDQYLNTVLGYGDTTIYTAQITALHHYGLTSARFRFDLDEKDILAQLQNNKPVPVGILHQGHVSNPVGSGHYILIKGLTTDGHSYIVHDPFGDLDLVGGVYLCPNGKDRIYSKRNLLPRWRVRGTGGWGMIV